MNATVDVAIIGAGPYGLSLASHLKQHRLSFRIFGSPMRFWHDMPRGVALKSFDFATNIYVPSPHHSFVEYCRSRGISSRQPVDMSVFTEYGMWVHKELVPEVEDIEVVNVSRSGDDFDLALAGGERLRVRRVVIAVGLRYFERIPQKLAALPSELVSHTSRHKDYSVFRGRDVAVLGGGQSAIEAAALLHEHGASVRMIVRAEGVWFADEMADHRPVLDRIRNPQTVMGPGRINWMLEHFPALIHYAPEKRRVRFTRRHLGPFGTWWLRDKVIGCFPIHLRTEVLAARSSGGHVVLRLSAPDGESEVTTDHVVAGTGYEVDVDRIPFIDMKLAATIQRIERAPKLDRHFQSSVPGLYFVGAASAFSFGPLMRFVCGTAYAAPSVARHLRSVRHRASAAGIRRVQAETR